MPAHSDIGVLARRLLLLSATASGGLGLALFFGFWITKSQLALAQAADSASDAIFALGLLVSLHFAAAPPDADHPLGHHRAEPIAALIAAVLAGVLGVEVVREAVGAARARALAELPWWLAAVFAGKMAVKIFVMLRAAHGERRHASPALRVIEVDARNDVLVACVTLVAFVSARLGWPALDAWVAIPVGLWIVLSGIGLARENVELLMGASASAERRGELLALIGSVSGVESAHALTVRFDGHHLDVSAHIVVDEALSVRAAHDIAEAVERLVRAEADVVRAMVHVDVEPDRGAFD